jgi:hypothetical protein
LDLQIHVCNDVDYASLFSVRFKNYVVHKLDLSINVIFNVLAIICTIVIFFIDKIEGTVNLIHPSSIFLVANHHDFDRMELLAHCVLLNCEVLVYKEILLFLVVFKNRLRAMAITLLSKLFGESYIELWFDNILVFVFLLGFLMRRFNFPRVFIEVDVIKFLFFHFGEVKFIHFKNRILRLSEFNV